MYFGTWQEKRKPILNLILISAEIKYKAFSRNELTAYRNEIDADGKILSQHFMWFMNALDGFLNEKQPYEAKSYSEILKLVAQILRRLQSNPKKLPVEIKDEVSIENAVQHIKEMYLITNDLIIRLDSSHPEGPALLYDKLVAKSKDAIAFLQTIVKIAIISSASYHLVCHKAGNKAQLPTIHENHNLDFVTSNYIAGLFSIEDS